MIIVSQNKKAITNFNNIDTIMISEHSLSDITDKKDYKIISFDNTYRSSDNYSDVLGTYKTEERAKEVLKEIIQKSEDISLANLMDNLQIAIHNKNFNGALSSVYYMPED